MKLMWRIVAAVMMMLSAGLGAEAADGDLTLHTQAEGPVAGEIRVGADLGRDGPSAELFLDGTAVCALTVAEPECTVDLGSDLHVHLLELIRTASDGGTSRVERWLNRPGREAGLEIELATRPIGDMCGGRLLWHGFAGQSPATLVVDAAGDRLMVPVANRTFAYPCAAPGETRVVAASAVFSDGRRTAAAVETDENGRATGMRYMPVAFEMESTAGDPCAAAAPLAERGPRIDRRQGFEVAFVLDPTADYRALAGLSEPSSGSGGSWRDIEAAFSQADGLWFVVPDDRLGREDGFALGRNGWVGRFFDLGLREPRGRVRLGDAVAAAGLVAGAAPNRRAVVLVLGPETGSATGDFNPAQARAYLAEIGVPLFVIRTGRPAADGWPAGVAVNTMTELASALEGVRGGLDRQCVGWVPADQRPEVIAASLASGVVIAGRNAVPPETDRSVWRRAAAPGSPLDDRPITKKPVASERVEVTAVTMLARIHDEDGRPVTDLSADDLAVTEDGRSVPVLAAEPVRELRSRTEGRATALPVSSPDSLPTRKIVPVVVYVDRRLAGSADIAPALAALAERSDWLASLGPVDIVVADNEVVPYLERASDPAAVRASLEGLSEEPFKGHAIERIRTEYVRGLREYPDRGRPQEGGDISSSTPDNYLRVRTMMIARSSIFQEDALLRSTMARMNDWALGLPSIGPRLLFLVGTGFDEDPIDFYLYFLEAKEPSLAAAARAEFLRYNQAVRVDSVGRELAAAGWMVVPVATRIAGAMRVNAEHGGGEKFQAFLTDRNNEGGFLRDVDFMLLDPLGSQQHLAEASGGKVVVGGRGLDKLISESSGWYRVTYQVDRAPDGALHEVTVDSNRSGVVVESSEVVVSGTSEGRASMRLRKLLEDPSLTGELPVRLEIGDPNPTDEDAVVANMTVIVNFAPIAPLFADSGGRVLRFSVAVRGDAGVPSIHHQLATADGAIGGMRYEVPIRWTMKKPSGVAVVVEDLGSGAWGGTIQELTGF